MSTVFVGLSGGVDSSVAALLLKQQGFNVVGVYMKNWTKNLTGFYCPWKDDYQDAKHVAVQLGIDFEVFDFEDQYFEKVVNYMIDAYKTGLTPNPDIMCNQEIKFKLFLDTSLNKGADMIATGHYARVEHLGNKQGKSRLLSAVDENKDQTYFLHRISQPALSKSLFPIGGFSKPDVRDMALKQHLITATKKESMGICFIGKVGIKEFLSNYIKTEPGAIINQDGIVVGEHDGAIFYTIGQRHGLHTGGGLPYYVTSKNMDTNEVYVTTDLNSGELWTNNINCEAAHFIGEPINEQAEYRVRLRHRGPLLPCSVSDSKGTSLAIVLSESTRAVTPGQSAVIYDKDGLECLGGAVVGRVN